MPNRKCDVPSGSQVNSFVGDNGDPMTADEMRALRDLDRLARRWPSTLTLVSMGGSLHVVHTNDDRFHSEHSPDRSDSVLWTVLGIPNDGGDW